MASKGSRKYEFDEELSEILTKLWHLDTNFSQPEVHYELDKQGYVTNAREVGRDRAHDTLFVWLDEDAVFNVDTYKTFRALLDNYEEDTTKREVVTAKETAENWAFLDAVMETEVMKEAHRFLAANNKAPFEDDEFKEWLYDMWFKIYRRTRDDRVMNSSGFEHVFVGEVRGESVIGFHNWIQMYLQEKRGNIDYKGYFRRGTSDEEHPHLMTLQFSWKEEQGKPIGSSFIGTSPEFEIALYTLVYLMDRGDRVAVDIAGYQVEIVVHGHGRGIGTAYPDAI